MPLLPDAEPYAHDGNNVGIIVSHGFTGQPKSVKPWAKHLADAGFTVRAPRLPGHGTRWQEMNNTVWQDWYAEIERTYRELSEKCDQVFVMGLSMGGSLALRLAEEKGQRNRRTRPREPGSPQRTSRPPSAAVPAPRDPLRFPGIVNDIKKPGQDEGAVHQAAAQGRLLTHKPLVGREDRHHKGQSADPDLPQRR